MVSRPHNHPLELFARAKAAGETVHIAGPMVRYSKLPFRATVRELSENVLIYSPMILAREFIRAKVARDSDFSTNDGDSPLIVQFGASNAEDFSRAAKMIMPYCDGVGLNCGCPIKEQNREGIGAALMTEPEQVSEMVRAAKRECGPDFCIEVKIRIHTDLDETVRFAKMVEEAGVDYITVHGRRKCDRSSLPVNLEGIRRVKEAVKCPVVANGDCFKPADVERIVSYTKVDGVMSVRGILANPAIFAGYETTPWKAIEIFWDHAMEHGLPFQLIQHHMSEMLNFELTRKEKKAMNFCQSTVELLDWFDNTFDMKRRGEQGFGERVDWPWKIDRSLLQNADTNDEEAVLVAGVTKEVASKSEAVQV